jgi:hypothetical protein
MSDTVKFRYRRIQPYIEIAYCPGCDIPLKNSGVGERFTSFSIVIHTCEKCHIEYKLNDYYPRTVYIEVEGLLEDKPVSMWGAHDKPQSV